MYAPAYGYGPANPSSAPSFNGGAPQQQQQQLQLQQQPPNPHHPSQQSQPGQQPQHLMYNPQQFSSPYGGGPGPAPGMGPNAGAMGMMQNNGMAHMPGGGMLHTQCFPVPVPTSLVALSLLPPGCHCLAPRDLYSWKEPWALRCIQQEQELVSNPDRVHDVQLSAMSSTFPRLIAYCFVSSKQC